MLFYIIMAADAFLSVLILTENIRSGPLVRSSPFPLTRRPLSLPFLTVLPPCVICESPQGEQRIAAPPFELPVVSFVVGSVAKVVGLWGVYADSLRHLTIFIAVCLLISIRMFPAALSSRPSPAPIFAIVGAWGIAHLLALVTHVRHLDVQPPAAGVTEPAHFRMHTKTCWLL